MRLLLLWRSIPGICIVLFVFACDSRVSTDDSCETLLGICPMYDTPRPEINGLFETTVYTRYHASGHSLTFDEAGNFIVGGYMHLEGFSDVFVYPVPITLRFDREGTLMDSTWHENLGYGTISGISGSGPDYLVTTWTRDLEMTGYRFVNPNIAFSRLNRSSGSVTRLFERPVVHNFYHIPGLYLQLPRPATGGTVSGYVNTPLAIETVNGSTILMTFRLTPEEQGLYVLDREGAVSWSYQMQGNSRVQAVVEAQGGDLFVVGGIDFSLRYDIARLTTSGEEVWYKTYDEGDGRYLPVTIAASADAFYVLGARKSIAELVVIKHSLGGDIVWKKTVAEDNHFSPAGYWESGNMIVTSTGKIVVVSTSDSPEERRYRSRLIVLDPEGEIERTIEVSPSFERVHVLALKEYDTDRVVLTGGAGRYHTYDNGHDILLVGYQL